MGIPWRHIRRLLICLIVIIFGFWLIGASAQFVDLKGGDVLGKSACAYNHKTYLCVLVSKDDNLYVVLLDQKGEYEIYLIGEDESKLIWARDSV